MFLFFLKMFMTDFLDILDLINNLPLPAPKNEKQNKNKGITPNNF